MRVARALRRPIVLATLALAAVTGCVSPGTPVPAKEAAELDVATSRISVACGYDEELTAYQGSNPPGLPGIESVAVSGARKLASVYARNQTGIYQGESVGAIVNDSISLLAGCRLGAARELLERALDEHR